MTPTLILAGLLACGRTETSMPHGSEGPGGAMRGSAAAPRNILLIISDDVGTDQSACYSRPVTTRAPQPNIEVLCRNGVAFDLAWSSPYCSPTRAGLLTGRHASRTGVGSPLHPTSSGPSLDEAALPELIKAIGPIGAGYATGAFGKWHLADEDNGGVDHPNLAGFDHYAGALSGHLDDFYSWSRVENGETETVTDYATTRTVDDAIAWLNEQDGPWFAQVAFHAPHNPFHLPPSDLHSFDHLTGDEDDIDDHPEEYYQAMLEAMDTEIGRLLSSLNDEARANTVIIYMSDNGTESKVNQGTYASSKSKGTLYQGGVHVPLIIGGAGVAAPGRRVSHPVNTLDLFATIIALAEGDLSDLVPADTVIDSVSLMPYLVNPRADRQRETVVAEVFGGTVSEEREGQAVSDGRYKLIRWMSGTEAYFDLVNDPTESTDLLTLGFPGDRAERLYNEFSAELDELPLPE